MPLLPICLAALKLRAEKQEHDRAAASEVWQDDPLVFTTRHGTPFEPWNFNRQFAAVPQIRSRLIRVHDTLRTRFELDPLLGGSDGEQFFGPWPAVWLPQSLLSSVPTRSK